MPNVDVLVLGGGVIGLSTAEALSRQGASVTVVDQGQLGRGCSYGNAGLIAPSYSMPVGTPETLFNSFRWLFDKHSLFTLKPRFDFALLTWLLRFVAACRPRNVAASLALLHELSKASMQCLTEFADRGKAFGLQREGWLQVFTTEAGREEGFHQMENLRHIGVRALTLDVSEVRELEPLLAGDVVGGVYYPDDAHLEPDRFVAFLASLAEDEGVTMLTRTRVNKFETGGGQILGVNTDAGELSADNYVIAAGAWSTPLLRQLDGRLPIQPAKGYSLTYMDPSMMPGRPLMFAEAHVVVTPMGRRLRMTGGLELVGFDPSLNTERLDGIRRAGIRYLSSFEGGAPHEAWCGYRPLTPDTLPIIGPTRRFPNLFIASGHGQLGVTLALVTGKLVAEYLSGAEPSIDLQPFLPSRFGL